MKTVLLYRYLYKSRYYYIAVLFIYIAALSCGISCAGAMAEKSIYSYTIWSILLKTTLPVVAIGLGGLFFAGNILIFAAVCYSAYTCGFIIGAQFAVSFLCGVTYIFFCAVPLDIVYMCCTLFTGVTAFQCNAARYAIRKKGLARPMTSYEIRIYSAKMMLALGVNVIEVILEYYVFAAAYVNLLK